jgi:hypothetical protein
VHDIVAMTWTARKGGNDAQIIATHEHLRIARPSVVLRFPRSLVISGWNQRPVDDPRISRFVRGTHVGRASSGELRGDRGNDAMGGGFRDPKHDCQLAKGQVRAQRHARDQDAAAKAS